MLKDVKKQERSNKSYRDDNQCEQVYQVNERAANMQLSPVANLPIPMLDQTG